MANMANKFEYILEGWRKSTEWEQPIDALQWIKTPEHVITNLINKVDLVDKNIGVLFNPVIVVYLLHVGINPRNIWFYYDGDVKKQLGQACGIELSHLIPIVVNNKIDNILRFEFNMVGKKIDVWITNPPYQEKKGTGAFLYDKVINQCLDTIPDAMIVICPTAIFYSPKMAKLKNRIRNNYHLRYVWYLSNSDWLDQDLGIATLGFIIQKSKKKALTLIQSGNGETFEYDFNINDSMLDMGTSVMTEIVIKHQTTKKISFKRHGPGDRSAQVIGEVVAKISSKGGQSGSYTTLTNAFLPQPSLIGWKVVIGNMRSSVVVVVPPNIGIPMSKYRYMTFDTLIEAENMRAYLMTLFIRTIAFANRESKTADAPQFKFIPYIELSQFVTVNDDVVSSYFGIGNDLKLFMQKKTGNQNPY